MDDLAAKYREFAAHNERMSYDVPEYRKLVLLGFRDEWLRQAQELGTKPINCSAEAAQF